MDSDNIVREVARFSNGFHTLIELLVKELDAHIVLMQRLEDKIKHLEQKADAKEEKLEDIHQKVDILMIAGRKGYSMTDLGNMVDEISKEGLLDDYINEKISDHPDVASEDSIREWARDEAQEVLSNASFDITVN